jgi:predicted CXXCH cytochrome family protein
MILYTRNDFNGKGTQVGPSVECGSCHDPHNAATAVAGESPAFMRIANTSSNVCLACHNK